MNLSVTGFYTEANKGIHSTEHVATSRTFLPRLIHLSAKDHSLIYLRLATKSLPPVKLQRIILASVLLRRARRIGTIDDAREAK